MYTYVVVFRIIIFYFNFKYDNNRPELMIGDYLLFALYVNEPEFV